MVAIAASSVRRIADIFSSLIEPTAHAEENTGVRSQKSEVRDQKLDVRLNHAAKAEIRSQATGIRRQESGDRRSNHATSAVIRGQRSELRNHTTTASVAFAPTPVGSFPINGTGTGAGFTLPAGKTTTITFKATLNTPPNLSGPSNPKVTAQAILTGSFVGTPLSSDDPSVGGATDPTSTTVDLYDSTTTISASPSNSTN